MKTKEFANLSEHDSRLPNYPGKIIFCDSEEEWQEQVRKSPTYALTNKGKLTIVIVD